jgi:ribosome biogenesis GTPase
VTPRSTVRRPLAPSPAHREAKDRPIMLEFDFEALAALGLTSALAGHAVSIDEDRAVTLVRIIEVHRETIAIHDGRGARSARPLPRLVRALQSQGVALAVGDWALASIDAHGDGWLTARVPPSSRIARRDGEGRTHTIVSNVDVALIVMGLDDDFNPRRLERFLAIVHDQAIVPVVVLTKRDIAERDPALLDERLRALRERVPAAIAIHAVDATHASAAAALQPLCTPGTTLVLLGSSGAGKSTLINTLLGHAVQDTGPVRESDGRGMHTTTSRSLHRLPGGACVIDTPGVRTLRPDGDDAALAGSFADIEALAAACRFTDCRHEAEPGCAVRERIDADRLSNWRKLGRELARDTLTPLDRRRQVARFKVQGRAVKARMKEKRGFGY